MRVHVEVQQREQRVSPQIPTNNYVFVFIWILDFGFFLLCEGKGRDMMIYAVMN